MQNREVIDRSHALIPLARTDNLTDDKSQTQSFYDERIVLISKFLYDYIVKIAAWFTMGCFLSFLVILICVFSFEDWDRVLLLRK